MSFSIMLRGAAVSIALQEAETASVLKSGLCERLDQSLPAFARDPEIYGMVVKLGSAKAPTGDAASFADKFAGARLTWRLECFSKPTVSLIDVPISGYVAGLVLAGTHRAAGEGYRFSVEPGHLLSACDGGLAHWLAHSMTGVGTYLVATGRSIGGAEALRYGFVTHAIPAARFGEIEAGMAAADPVDPLLDDRHAAAAPTPTELALDRLIADCFATPRLDVIRARLTAVAATDAAAASILGDVETTAAAGHLEAALGVLERAMRSDMRTTLIASFSLADAAYPAVQLPTRAEHQALRNR